jgi:DeoR family transcriptional regulator, suf operon transcriptional repressor
MQETRQYILDILRGRTQATVDELVDDLAKRRGTSITAVTVRHHLNELLKEQLITTAELKHRDTPGRPQHVYVLTEAAREYFPSNFQPLLTHLIEQLSSSLSNSQINVLFEGVADCMAADAFIPVLSPVERLECVVSYLNDHGYNANWQQGENGFILNTTNCPYHQLAEGSRMLCEMDMRLVSSLLGIVPRLISRISDGDSTCSYFIPEKTNSTN